MNTVDIDFDITYQTMFRENPESDDSDTQYRRELLKFFKLETYDDTRIGIRTDKLYYELIKEDQFLVLFNLIMNEPMLSFVVDDGNICSACLSMLCSFNYFHLLFKSIREFKQHNIISEETFTEFRNEIIRNTSSE